MSEPTMPELMREALRYVPRDPLRESAEPCENCGLPVVILTVTGSDSMPDIPRNLYEISPLPVGWFGSDLKTHTPERCRAARRERRDERD